MEVKVGERRFDDSTFDHKVLVNFASKANDRFLKRKYVKIQIYL